MLQKDDLKQVVSELVEELIGKKSQTDLTRVTNTIRATKYANGSTSPTPLCGVCRKRVQSSFTS